MLQAASWHPTHPPWLRVDLLEPDFPSAHLPRVLITLIVSRDDLHILRGAAYTKFKGHPTAVIHGNSPALGQPPSDGFPSKNRSQGLCHLVGLWQQIHIIEVCRMLFRSIAASSWQPPARHFIAERLRLPRGSFSLRWERCGCFCCASCGKGWGFCKGSAQKCCCFLASSGLLPCTRECGIETGRCPRAGARWFLQVKPLM